MKKTVIIITLSLILTAVLFSCGGGGGGVDDAIEDTSYSIGYNSNGAESGAAPAAQSGNGKASLSISANTGGLAKNGYLFDGWNTQPDGYGADYAPGTEYNGKKNITLYAKWARLFNYKVNSISPAPSLDDLQKTPGVPTVTITGLTSRGMTLSDITIPRTIDGYTVVAIGDNAFQGCTNVANMLIPDTVTDIGDNAFNGCSNLSGVTMQGTVPPALGTDAFAGCVLLAVTVPQSAASAYNSSPTWSTVAILAPGTFSIIYNGNGSDGGIVPARQVGMIGINLNIYGNNGSLTRAGCTFNGWNDKADGTGHSYVENAFYPGPDNITLYAQWYHPDYTVTFDDQGADIQHVAPSNIKVIAPANTISELPATSPKKDGYYFAGWYTGENGIGDSFVSGSQVVSDKTVYAKWNEGIFQITYKDQGGAAFSGVHGNNYPTAHTYGTNTVLVSPTRDDYSFGGWYFDSDCTGQSISMIEATAILADTFLYAKWIPVYSVAINNVSNGTVTSSSTSNITAGTTITLTIMPNSGYELKTITVTEIGGGTISTTPVTLGRTYTFSMPSGKVVVNAIFQSFSPIYENNVSNLEAGDVVLGNGKYVAYNIFSNHAAAYLAISSPVGIIAYKGHNSIGIQGKVYMVGLNQTVLRWASYGSRSKKFTTSDYIGENNWAVITEEDTVGSASAEINYPAFNYVNTYNVTGYNSGWFIPSKYELQLLRGGAFNTINNSINTIIDSGGNGTALQERTYWSSSQNSDLSYEAYSVSLRSNDYIYYKTSKVSELPVLVVHALDD